VNLDAKKTNKLLTILCDFTKQLLKFIDEEAPNMTMEDIEGAFIAVTKSIRVQLAKRVLRGK